VIVPLALVSMLIPVLVLMLVPASMLILVLMLVPALGSRLVPEQVSPCQEPKEQEREEYRDR